MERFRVYFFLVKAKVKGRDHAMRHLRLEEMVHSTLEFICLYQV